MNGLRIKGWLFGAALLLAACGGSDNAEKAKADEAAQKNTAPADGDAQPSAPVTFVAEMLDEPPLGLPPVPVAADNPLTIEKIRLGEVLFNDTRFSSTGEISCATCHEPAKAFTDGPLSVSEGVDGLTGTRNAPTVINAAYFDAQFWDGRRPSLEAQSGDPFLNPVEMNLPSHDAILDIVRKDKTYKALFNDAFGLSGASITMDHVKKAIASFERAVVSGDSPFDRWRYGGEADAISEAAKRGFDVYMNDGRCVSCHTISQTHAIFTDNKFHNLGIGFDKISDDAEEVVGEFLRTAKTDQEVDEAVLGNENISEIGRFAVSREMQDIGQFKTPTLRNVAATAPYMHDGSHKTLRQVVEFYNTAVPVNAPEGTTPNPFQSGGIRPLDLTDQQIDDLVEFLKALTSPQFEAAAEVSLANQAAIDAAP